MEPSPLGSVDKALLTLDALGRAGADGASLADLSAEVGANKSTLHRTLAALRHRGYAEQTDDGTYRLGPAVLALGSTFLAEENLPALLRPALDALSAEVDELVHLGVLAGREVVYLEKVEPQRAVRVWSAVGRRRPAATTALGRALLAAGPFDDAALAAYATPGTAADRLREALAEARHTGVATETEENEPGIACAAVAVLRAGRPIAAVSITAPAERMTGAAREARIAALREVLPAHLPADLTVPAG
ncbi:IclR family transcriptional regulator [Isoptericola sp. CG 20/1183]|uniref:IclR family transcriptional regulator n=1 Tax=Isoptericola halotolerans TaxID=300560 RepID=A0ABX5EIS0_9MICO|nr:MULTISPECIES: IclR family transcriptional regulator [Isoptericola]PRZ09531.1 IclR family transcriptional regulator [Isoptericola sp. CG 20/1183]PRZ10332.1 IclR family transcriptional regulator [Isoptericola halotolerans]